MRCLSISDRRSLGVTFYGFFCTLRAMKRDGVDFKGVSSRERAEMVFSRLIDDRPAAAAAIDWKNIDWEAVWAFIEKIIELIMKLITLF